MCLGLREVLLQHYLTYGSDFLVIGRVPLIISTHPQPFSYFLGWPLHRRAVAAHRVAVGQLGGPHQVSEGQGTSNVLH